MADAEFIVVCIDDAWHMHPSTYFEAQLDAIKCYCETKLDANPKTELALFTMGDLSFGRAPCPVTSNFQEILDFLPSLGIGAGRLLFRDAINRFRVGFRRCPPYKHKRMLFFATGLVDLNNTAAVYLGKKLKGLGIAVDVVNFYLGEKPKLTTMAHQFGRTELDAFVDAANYKNNSHIEHVKPRSSIPQVLSKSMLRDSLRLLSMKNHKKATGKNQAAGDDKHVPSEALSPENEGVKLGKRKIEATGWETKRYTWINTYSILLQSL